MQSKKAAIELPVNFLIIIILSLIILGFSIYFLSTIVSKATELSKLTQEDLDKRVEALQCSGRVCMAVNYKKIPRGKFEIFGLRIYNDAYEGITEFIVTITPTAAPTGATKALDYLPQSASVKLDKYEEKRVGIGIEVPKDAASGLYIFNIKVQANSIDYGTPQQIRIEVP